MNDSDSNKSFEVDSDEDPSTSKAPVKSEIKQELGSDLQPNINLSIPSPDIDLKFPLRHIIPERLKYENINEHFPEFQEGEPLKHLRIFPPLHEAPKYWQRKTTRGKERAHPQPSKVVDEFATDDEELWHRPELAPDENEGESTKPTDSDLPSWRYGPAKYWFDLMNVPYDGAGFDYGFKLKEEGTESAVPKRSSLNLESQLLLSQQTWEDEINWCLGDDSKSSIVYGQRDKSGSAGWIPSAQSRSITAFYSSLKHSNQLRDRVGPPLAPAAKAFARSESRSQSQRTTLSLFPVQNDDLLMTAEKKWEDNIIWDPERMDSIPTPLDLVIDPNDDYLIIGFPDEGKAVPIESKDTLDESGSDSRIKKSEKELKKSRILDELNKQNRELAAETGDGHPKEDEDEDELRRLAVKDPWNLSNDEFYNPKQDNVLKANIGSTVLQHSTPAVELRLPFFPTHMSRTKLRTLHRVPLKRFARGMHSLPGKKPIHGLSKIIAKKAKQREADRAAYGGGGIFVMRQMSDLSAMDGEIILAEYCEEYPPIMMQPGMATKIKNYFRRKSGKGRTTEQLQLKYGDNMAAPGPSASSGIPQIFLGYLKPGEFLQALENNMFRAPIYEQRIPSSDFLVIRTRKGYYIREADDIFTVGQECPLMEVQGPHSKLNSNFIRDFLQVYIYRLFMLSTDKPKRIRTEDVKRGFPFFSETTLRKRLKVCADFRRSGADSGWWMLRDDFRLPSEEELREMVSPEQCCAYYSMLWSEQRLRDAGYGEKSLFGDEMDELKEERHETTKEEEILNAPWNTTRAYISAAKGKCLINVTGACDPTGCGEGFSYQRLSLKQMTKDESVPKEKRTVTGTNADLRKLQLKEAKDILRKYKVPESEIKKLTRWEIIDLIRTLSTEKARQGCGEDKFARLSKFSAADQVQRFYDECQRVFDLQNRVLSSTDILSSDDASSASDEDADNMYEQMSKHIENIFDANTSTGHSTSSHAAHPPKKLGRPPKNRPAPEDEEQQRRELQQLLLSNTQQRIRGKDSKTKSEGDSLQKKPTEIPNTKGKILKITRIYRGENGARDYPRVEIVTKPEVVASYARIRATKDASAIQQITFQLLELEEKDALRKEKRRIQDRIRRIDYNLEHGKFESKQKRQQASSSVVKKPPKQSAVSSKTRCGACGGLGHMRTNRECPFFAGGHKAALTDEQIEEQMQFNMQEDEDGVPRSYVKVEDTKIRLDMKLVEKAEDMRRESLKLKFPPQPPQQDSGDKPRGPGRPRKRLTAEDLEQKFLSRAPKMHRQRADPIVSLATMLEHVINDMKDIPESEMFWKPVNPKSVPDYYNIVTNPMDLQTMRDKARSKRYRSREDFLTDVNLLIQNSKLYNGARHPLTLSAESMLEMCLCRFAEKETRLMKLEKAINPLLDDNDQRRLSYVFDQIIESVKLIEGSWPFQKPVLKKKVKDYYEMIKNPIDLETIQQRVKAHHYHHRSTFLADIQLLHSNCIQYNGPNHPLVVTAQKLVDTAQRAIEQNDLMLKNLEDSVRRTQEAALEGLDSISVTTSNREDPYCFESESVDNENISTWPDSQGRHRAQPASSPDRDESFDVDRFMQQQESGLMQDDDLKW